jgi:nucleoside-diphosphate-sugar epimerase
MASQTRGARGHQRPEQPRARVAPVVAVTAAGGPAGSGVVDALAAAIGAPGGPSAVIALDIAGPGRDLPAGVSWREQDVTDPAVVAGLSGADVVVHLAAPDNLAAALGTPWQPRRARAVRAVQAVATSAVAAGASRLVVVTSAMVFGARADNPVPLDDDDPRRAATDEGLVGDLLEVERVVARTPLVHPGLQVTLVRPVTLVGRGADTTVSRHFEAPRWLVLRGAQGRWQFCHVDDLGAAVVTVVRAGLTGELSVGARGWLDDETVERVSGLRRVEVPPGLAISTAERLHRLGLLRMPPSDLAFVTSPWVVGAQRLRAAGWAPSVDNRTALEELLRGLAERAAAGRRIDRREVALGAAGAAVAIIGTAALVRQTRQRQVRHRGPRVEG